jgi:uncharacterized repeat protein (TIGR03847 family)
VTRRIFEFADPERFVVGTVGQPGERQFFLQVREGHDLTTVALEKAQAQVLAERIDALLDEAQLQERGSIPDRGATSSYDSDPLEAPIDGEFQVGAMALGWDEASERVIIETHEVSDEPVAEIGDDGPGPSTVRIWCSAEQARAFAERARRVVAAGRPACALCGQPLDPSGHLCPRANGYRRRAE